MTDAAISGEWSGSLSGSHRGSVRFLVEQLGSSVRVLATITENRGGTYEAKCQGSLVGKILRVASYESLAGQLFVTAIVENAASMRGEWKSSFGQGKFDATRTIPLTQEGKSAATSPQGPPPAGVFSAPGVFPVSTVTQGESPHTIEPAEKQDASGGVGPEVKTREDLNSGRGGERIAQELPRWDRPHVENDRVGGQISADDDRLDARKPARRFAKLLAAVDVQPPIAVGLFGNWGAGKTFFMGLVRQHVTELQNSGPAYVKRVVQIEFNAWHFQDSNLWACLALHIFDRLADALSLRQGPENCKDQLENNRAVLHSRMESSKALKAEAEARRKRALEDRQAAAKELEAAKRKQGEVKKNILAKAWKIVEKEEEFKPLVDAANGLFEQFGIAKFEQNAEDLMRLRKDVESVRRRGAGLLAAVGQRFAASTWQGTVAVLLAFLALALTMGVCVEALVAQVSERLANASALTAQLSLLLSGVVAWSGRRVRQLHSALAAVERVMARLNECAIPEVDIVLQNKIDEADQQILQATQEMESAIRTIEAATVEIERIDRGGLVYDFLEERLASNHYLKQVGLLSILRKDLEKLGVLLADFQKDGKEPIERIVLYIDDLDRCHPRRVVEVLQAVHLLLAFPLFNVVVGVDARWLERSLLCEYAGHAGDEGFSPQDYLEKIFQIPYVLAPMSPSGYQELVKSLVQSRSEWNSQRELAARSAQAVSSEENGPPLGIRENVSVIDDVVLSFGSAKAQEERALFLEDHEEAFIKLFHAFIDRPRLAKRFLNIYRLVRVEAYEHAPERGFAASPESDDYRAAIVLLAINVGHPRVATRLFFRFELVADQDLDSAFTALAADNDLRSEIEAVQRKLRPLKPQIPSDLNVYLAMAPRIACYSFSRH